MTDTTATHYEALRGGAAAAPFYVTGEDDLRLVLHAALACTVTVEGRFLNDAGDISPFVEPFVSTDTTRVAQTFSWRLGCGWVMSLSVRVTSGTPAVGQVYAQVRAQRGQGNAAINIGTLVQGYVTESDDLSYPASPMMPSVAGPGVIRRATLANPAAGANFTFPVPTRVRWRPIAICFTLAAVGAANREVVLSVDDGVGTIAIIPAGVTQIAAETRTYTFFHAAPRGAGTQSPHVIAPLPPLILMAAWNVSTAIVGIQVGDQLSAISITTEEWIED